MTEKPKPKPCPFCGREPDEDWLTHCVEIRCRRDGACDVAPWVAAATFEEALRRWNGRAEDADLRKRVAMLETLLEYSEKKCREAIDALAAAQGVTAMQDPRALFGKWPGEPNDGFEETINEAKGVKP